MFVIWDNDLIVTFVGIRRIKADCYYSVCGFAFGIWGLTIVMNQLFNFGWFTSLHMKCRDQLYTKGVSVPPLPTFVYYQIGIKGSLLNWLTFIWVPVQSCAFRWTTLTKHKWWWMLGNSKSNKGKGIARRQTQTTTKLIRFIRMTSTLVKLQP